MISIAKPGHVLLTTTLAVAASMLGAGQAPAQWGMGGMGIGFYGGGLFGNVQQPNTFLNQVALAQMNHVRGPMQNNVYAGNPNSYLNRVRDNGFVDRYSPYRGEPAYSGYSARPPAQPTTPTAAGRTRPLVPLASFFNAQNQLIWPGDAPIAGDLKEKRDAFDRACRTVLDEVKQSGMASIGSVTEARRKVLDYGREALKYVREHETARVADGFHVFLLSLYDSLAQAAGGA